MINKGHRTSKRAIGLAIITIAIFMVVYSTIGISRPAIADVTNTLKIGTPPSASPSGTLSPSASPSGTLSPSAPLISYIRHVANGTADIVWDVQKQTLNVKITMSGLAPKSTHPAQIHMGSCETGDKGLIRSLSPIIADAKGAVTSLTTTIPMAAVPQIKSGIPASGWFIDVQNGPALLLATQKISIACGDILNVNPSITSTQIVDLTLWSTKAPNQAVSGNATFSVTNNQLKVTLTAGGFAPSSTHMADISLGTCKAQGKVLYPLKPIIADKNGLSTSITIIPEVTLIPDGWYAVIHLASSASDLATQTGFDPIACTNVPPSSGAISHTPSSTASAS